MKKNEGIAETNYLEILLSNIDEQDFEFPTELVTTQLNEANINVLYDQSKKIMSTIIQYKELMMMYNCALKQIRTKFEILNTEFNVRYQRNPINSINTRQKRPTSILEKMKRNRIPLSVENIESRINDVAGIRVICTYVDDIYVISQALVNQEDVELIEQKDYIANPKPNGYRSMHLIIAVPVFFADHMRHIKVEVQIRTIAMDFWATLEHQLKYKDQAAGGEEIVEELKECSDIIAETDSKMLHIRKKIEENSGNKTDEDILFDKIRRIDYPIE